MMINSVTGKTSNVPDTGTLIITDSAAVLIKHPSPSTIESQSSLYYITTSKNSIEIVNST